MPCKTSNARERRRHLAGPTGPSALGCRGEALVRYLLPHEMGRSRQVCHDVRVERHVQLKDGPHACRSSGLRCMQPTAVVQASADRTPPDWLHLLSIWRAALAELGGGPDSSARIVQILPIGCQIEMPFRLPLPNRQGPCEISRATGTPPTRDGRTLQRRCCGPLRYRHAGQPCSQEECMRARGEQSAASDTDHAFATRLD